MARSPRNLEIDGEGAFWAVAGFAVSILVGMALQPLRESAGLENVVVVYVIVVALTAAVGGRAAGLASALSAALAYNWFFTTPYGTLRIDTAGLPHLDEEGRIPSGHRRSVGGTLVLPAEGAVVDLVRRDQRVGALVIVPATDRPILKTTRMAIAATAHALANAR